METTRIESELKSSAKLRAFLLGLAASERAAFLHTLKPAETRYLLYDWPLWARAKQLPPTGEWRVWLLMAGRGFGKTRAGAEWVRWLATHSRHRGHIALVGDTFDDVRHVMVEGPSGILAVSPSTRRPQWYRSQRRLIWSNGVGASCFSASDPEQLRGPEFSFAWADEKISPQITPKQRTSNHPGREQASTGHPGTGHPGAAPAATGQAGPGSDGYNHDAR